MIKTLLVILLTISSQIGLSAIQLQGSFGRKNFELDRFDIEANVLAFGAHYSFDLNYLSILAGPSINYYSQFDISTRFSDQFELTEIGIEAIGEIYTGTQVVPYGKLRQILMSEGSLEEDTRSSFFRNRSDEVDFSTFGLEMALGVRFTVVPNISLHGEIGFPLVQTYEIEDRRWRRDRFGGFDRGGRVLDDREGSLRGSSFLAGASARF